MGDAELQSTFLKGNLAFLDGQRLMEPSVNGQIGFDFQGLRRSFKEDASHPDSARVARFGRIWVYDLALSIYADLKADRLRQAGYQAGRVMQLAQMEQEKGFQGLWHFSYNTRGDSFIDPRGPAGANCWCLNALYSYAMARGDTGLLAWANQAVRRYLFGQQVMDSSDPRYGLVRAGLHNADDLARGDEMGYRVYEGDLNHPYQHVILEHCADATGTLRLAFRATRKFLVPGTAVPGTSKVSEFLGELIHRHDLLMQGIRRCFWQKDHFISALDPAGKPYEGTDGLPSIAVDNNTWSAHVFVPYDLEMARAAIKFVEQRFRVNAPPAHLEDTRVPGVPEGMEGLYYFPATFSDPFVLVPEEHRVKMAQMIHPEATFGLILFLLAVSKASPDPWEQEKFSRRAEDLYQHMVQLLQFYGSSGAPYASVNVPAVFSTLHCITTAASSVVTMRIFHGVSGDDFIGVLPPREFTVEGKAPLPFAAE